MLVIIPAAGVEVSWTHQSFLLVSLIFVAATGVLINCVSKYLKQKYEKISPVTSHILDELIIFFETYV